MKRKKIVVALGHKALGTTLPEQKAAVKRSAKVIADLVAAGADVVITHSNAPQVGMIHMAMNEFGKMHTDYSAAPMSVCSAMSEGYIGYDLQNAIRAELLRRGIFKTTSTILTQVEVDPYDDAFNNPVKLIGRTLSKEEADAEEEKGNYVTKTEDGYRRIVAAPKPQDIVEIDSIRLLLDAGQVVIAAGGGGIPAGEHASFAEYLSCKKKLLRTCRTGIVNRDDKRFPEIIRQSTCRLVTFGCREKADFMAADAALDQAPGVLGVSYRVQGAADFPVRVDLPGLFSVSNSLAAIAVCAQMGIPEKAMQEALSAVRVRGRCEAVPVYPEMTLLIDYAHNAMSLESLLKTLRKYHPKRLICLFGCGGNRARDRRFQMGEVSGRLADLTVITSDNPRDEEPQAILDDIRTGIGKTEGAFVEIADRKEAIRYVIENRQPGDLVVLAGKGHETYQIRKGKRYEMDERVLIREILEESKGNV